MARRYYINGAPLVTLSTTVNNSATTLAVSSTSGFPASTPFTICIERSTANEEVCLVTAVGTNEFTVTRGWNGTTAVSHSSGASVEHTTAAADYDEANSHVNDTSTDVHSQYMLKTLLAAKGTIVSASAANTPSALAVGTNDYVLMAASGQTTGLKWGTIATASITNGAVTMDKLDSTAQGQTIRPVADATARTALSSVDGNMAYQQDTDRFHVKQNGAWTLSSFGVGKISYGTAAAPTSGDIQDGDVYLKYTA